MITLATIALANPPAVQMRVEGTEDELITLRPPEPGDWVPQVVGGTRAQSGEWDDAVGIVFDESYVGCTGTLVAPNVVITAAHCAGSITHVLVGSKDWFSNQGELLEVRQTHVHPSYVSAYEPGYDIAVLELRGQSSYPHRIIANDCIIEEELVNGALVTIAGFGATQANGQDTGNSFLRQAQSIVRDKNCNRDQIDGIYTGCWPSLRPGGEIAAGGRVDVDGDGSIDQADACFGDSGGPLYLHTTRGTFVVGVTSRGFLGVDQNFPCRDGGIWVRPDAVMNFIQNRTGVTMERPVCNIPPEVTPMELVARPGKYANTEVEVVDPDGDSFTIEVLEQPSLGELTVDGTTLWLTAYKGVEGAETVTVAVTDDGATPQTVEVPVEVVVVKGGLLQCGGCASGGSGLGGVGMLAGLIGLVRRRRR